MKAFPKLPFIGHAAGFWASISGDATLEDFGRYPPIPTPMKLGGALDRLMDRYPNLYGDLSEPGGHSAIAWITHGLRESRESLDGRKQCVFRHFATKPYVQLTCVENGRDRAQIRIARDPKFGRDFLVRRSERLLFGTDFLMANQEVLQFALLDSLKLPKDRQEQIFRRNAIRLLHLEGEVIFNCGIGLSSRYWAANVRIPARDTGIRPRPNPVLVVSSVKASNRATVFGPR
jgi:hypothetical protein